MSWVSASRTDAAWLRASLLQQDFPWLIWSVERQVCHGNKYSLLFGLMNLLLLPIFLPSTTVLCFLSFTLPALLYSHPTDCTTFREQQLNAAASSDGFRLNGTPSSSSSALQSDASLLVKPHIHHKQLASTGHHIHNELPGAAAAQTTASTAETR